MTSYALSSRNASALYARSKKQQQHFWRFFEWLSNFFKMPGKFCRVKSCKKCSTGLGFFSMPKDRVTFEKWKNLLDLSDEKLDISKRNFVCFRHFDTKDIKTGGKYFTLRPGKFFSLEKVKKQQENPKCLSDFLRENTCSGSEEM